MYGQTDDKIMGYCKAGVKFHPGAIEAYKEAGVSILQWVRNIPEAWE